MDTHSRTFYRYLPVAKRDRDWGLYVTTVGASNFGPNSTYPPSGHPKEYSSVRVGRSLREYQVIYISAGKGWFKAAGSPIKKVDAGQIIFLFPGVRHSYAPDPATGWSEHWIGFNGDLARRLRQRGFFSPSRPILTARDEEHFLALFNDGIKTIHDNHPALQQILAGITTNILSLLYSVQQFGSMGNEPELKIIQTAIGRMRESSETKLDLAELSQELNVSYRWFRR
ncbi:MAG: AraC family ligand binding domain-containing protein, partial [Limisphaerales bacterium]